MKQNFLVYVQVKSDTPQNQLTEAKVKRQIQRRLAHPGWSLLEGLPIGGQVVVKVSEVIEYPVK